MSRSLLTRLVYFLILISSLSLVSSCSGDDDDATPARVGNLKVATYYYHAPSGTSSYILRGGIKVELSLNGTVIATQYSPGIGTLDFGDYPYGTYSVQATGEEAVSSSGGFQHNANFNETYIFNIEGPTRTITFDFP